MVGDGWPGCHNGDGLPGAILGTASEDAIV